MKYLLGKKSFTGLVLFLVAVSASAADEKYLGVPLAEGGLQTSNTADHYGVPFLQGLLPLESGGAVQVNVGGTVERIFLLGMTDQISEETRVGRSRHGPSELIRPAVPLDAWANPRDQSTRFWVGDKLGEIRLNYADGTTQVYPLILGESAWWGRIFYDYSEPFATDAQLREAFTTAVRLYPPAPVANGNYIAIIKPKGIPLKSISFEVTGAKKGTVGIRGITLEAAGTNEISNAVEMPTGALSPELAKFAEEKALRLTGEDEKQTARELHRLQMALYSTEESFKGPVKSSLPPGYAGPGVSFKGGLSANILTETFYYNVQDIRNKIDAAGMYHTSTSNALSWGGYKGFGTFREGLGRYFDTAYSRDMGRSLQEVTMLGYTNEARRSADWALGIAHRWETEPRLKIDGSFVPQHWSMLAERSDRGSYENDGQGLLTIFIYKTWQWLPDRDDWLRSHWPDIKGLGDWILWQFDHPDISKATNGLLHTTGESAANGGYSVYPDSACMNALRALAVMADSIGETNSAAQWRDRADQMQPAITKNYIIDDPKYGRIWTLDYAGWPNKSTVLGPLIFAADCQGFAPRDDDAQWRPINEAAYQRLIDSYSPFGFYGQAMGYGQGFVTQSALLLDRMRDATMMLDWAAKEIYDPRFNQFDHYIVPEGVQISPDGRLWYRIGDLGNGVQEGEIVKMLRLVIGVDDTQPNRLQFYPRMPYDWTEMAVTQYPVLFDNAGKMETASLRYGLERSHNGMKLEISADKALGAIAMRLGPFKKQPEISNIRVNGEKPSGTFIEHSGDSWWVKFAAAVGPEK